MKRIMIAAALAMLSCSNFEEMNSNPNQILYNGTNPTKLLQELIYNSSKYVYYRSWKINCMLMQYATYVGGTELVSNYDVKASDSQQIWNRFYEWGATAQHVHNLAVAKDDPNCRAIALTLKNYVCEPITAMMGDVPYSEAFRLEEGISAPAFDSQKDIYMQMLDELELANSLYDTSEELDAPARDILYGGDILKWKKFTNSLRLRVLMRISKCTEVDAPALIDEMLTDAGKWPVFESNADAAILRPTGENPFYGIFSSSAGWVDPMSTNTRMGDTFISLLTSAADPRLPFFADANGGEYSGLLCGQTQDYVQANKDKACNFAKSLSSNTAPQQLMNFAEVLFLKAEARFRGFTEVGDVETYYRDAVTASIRQWLEDETYNPGALLESPSSAAWDGTLERLMEQKYVADFMEGYEAWCDYRRTGLPVMPVGPAMGNFNSDGEPVLPTRLVYPAVAEARNAGNYNAAVAALENGDNDMLSRLWFARGTRY